MKPKIVWIWIYDVCKSIKNLMKYLKITVIRKVPYVKSEVLCLVMKVKGQKNMNWCENI